MKKLTNVLGILIVVNLIVSLLMKYNNIPGGTIIATFNFIITLPIFMILSTIDAIKDKRNKALIIIGGIAVVVSGWGHLFTLNDWPAANFILTFGYIALTIVIFIAIFSQITKKDDEQTFSINNLLIFIIFLSLSFFLTKGEKYKITKIKKQEIAVQNSKIQSINKITDSLYLINENSNDYIIEFREKANDIKKIIAESKQRFLGYSHSNSFMDLSNKQLSCSGLTGEIMILEGKGADIKNKIGNFLEYMNQNDEILQGSQFANILLETNDIVDYKTNEQIPWEYYYFDYKTIADVVLKLNQIEIDILMIEQLILN